MQSGFTNFLSFFFQNKQSHFILSYSLQVDFFLNHVDVVKAVQFLHYKRADVHVVGAEKTLRADLTIEHSLDSDAEREPHRQRRRTLKRTLATHTQSAAVELALVAGVLGDDLVHHQGHVALVVLVAELVGEKGAQRIAGGAAERQRHLAVGAEQPQLRELALCRRIDVLVKVDVGREALDEVGPRHLHLALEAKLGHVSVGQNAQAVERQRGGRERRVAQREAGHIGRFGAEVEEVRGVLLRIAVGQRDEVQAVEVAERRRELVGRGHGDPLPVLLDARGAHDCAEDAAGGPAELVAEGAVRVLWLGQRTAGRCVRAHDATRAADVLQHLHRCHNVDTGVEPHLHEHGRAHLLGLLGDLDHVGVEVRRRRNVLAVLDGDVGHDGVHERRKEGHDDVVLLH
eukprot:PhM_4_TR289/c0_g1_i1/m.52266